MAIVSMFCKKGGVGKTTILGYMAHYYALQGKTILVLSIDDQNSIFKVFGKEGFIDENDNNFFDNYFAGEVGKESIICDARENMYLMKTLNTSTLSMQLTLKRSEEKKIRNIMADFENYFDYIFIDFPPSSNRLSEILLDISQDILLVVGLDALSLDGYKNTIQYFTDADIDLSKIRYIIPNNFNKVKRAPSQCLAQLKEDVKMYTPGAVVTTPVTDLAIIKNLQSEGQSIYDEVDLPRFHEKNKKRAEAEFTELFKEIHLS